MGNVTLRVVGEGVSTREISEGATIGSVLGSRTNFTYRVNGEDATADTPLRAGDRVDAAPTYKNAA